MNIFTGAQFAVAQFAAKGPNLPGPNLPGPNLPPTKFLGPNLPGPNLPGPDLPSTKFPGPNLPPRGPICRGPICRGPICRQGAQFAGAQFAKKWQIGPQKVWGPICRQIGEGPNLLGPNLPRTYKIIYVWKVLENLVPDANLTVTNTESDRVGRKCKGS